MQRRRALERSVNGIASIWSQCHTRQVSWIVEFGDEFKPEFHALPEEVQDELLARTRLLQQFGPQLGRPTVDTLNGSKHANMKEIRFNAAGGVWRAAFAFDPRRRAIVFVAGDKSGGRQTRFYKDLIARADARFERHLAKLRHDTKRNKEREVSHEQERGRHHQKTTRRPPKKR